MTPWINRSSPLGQPMTSYEVLEIIFRGKVKRLAAAFGIKETSAAKFLRDPHNSGAFNPLDRLQKVIDEAVLANRAQSYLIPEYLRQYHQRLINDQQRGVKWDPKQVAAEILQTAARAVQALALETHPPSEQLQALLEARNILDEAISQLEILNGDEGR
jgi:hypothetical protein